ncbi:MAG TPA: carbohydrate-binding domain-containing protein, partial [Ureibacillus sp.]|nr:carbohydrate-binding domain-containing protein [Ureibacillus sp.]
KGVKAGTELILAGGTFTIDSFDDAIHSNGTIAISGGGITVNTGEDGIHADTEVVISGGHLSVEKSYEGLEGKNITITDGTIHLVATDDGINVNSQEAGFSQMGGGMFGGNESNQATVEETASAEEVTEAEMEEGNLLIEGGYIYVNAAGDGLDSNNTAKMTGGTVIVYGPTNSGNGALDYANTFEIEGGTLIAAGSSGMAQGVSDSSSQNAIMMTFTDFQQAGTTVYVENSEGEQVFAIAPEKEFQTILISTPELEMDETYTLSSGGTLTGESTDGLYEVAEFTKASQSVEFALSTVMTYVNESGVTESSSNMMGGFGGGQRGGMGGGNPFTSSEDADENTDTNQ